MSLPDNDYQILRLTDLFYKTYPNPPYKEILRKVQRAYTCILFQTHYDYFMCIPFRTEIAHQYAYLFQDSNRSKEHSSGIDYTKMVIVNKTEFVDNIDAVIDKDEFIETIRNLGRIKSEALEFLEDYILHKTGKKLISRQEFNRRYRFSSLQYFDAVFKDSEIHMRN